MNSSTSIKIKKFISNKNTVTIICAIIAVIVLYVGYNMRVQSAVKPVTIPYAKVTIQPRTKITDDMIGYISVASAALDTMGGNVIIDKKEIINKYSNINTMIPQGSMFYNGAVVSKDKLPDAAVYDVPKGEELFYLNVNMTTSYVNSIVPGGYIDLYIRTTDKTTGKVRVGKFIENIKVLAVKTSDGQNVFENTDERRVPSYVLFSVPAPEADTLDEDGNPIMNQYLYLSAAQQLGLTIIPVPTQISEEEIVPESSALTSDDLIAYIDEQYDEFIQNQKVEDSNDDDGQNNDDPNNKDNNKDKNGE